MPGIEARFLDRAVCSPVIILNELFRQRKKSKPLLKNAVFLAAINLPL
jgi:hypothetical protein